MGVVKTVMFGEMEISDTRDEIIMDPDRCRRGFLLYPSGYLQTKIDYLEYALDRFRREEDV